MPGDLEDSRDVLQACHILSRLSNSPRAIRVALQASWVCHHWIVVHHHFGWPKKQRQNFSAKRAGSFSQNLNFWSSYSILDIWIYVVCRILQYLHVICNTDFMLGHLFFWQPVHLYSILSRILIIHDNTSASTFNMSMWKAENSSREERVWVRERVPVAQSTGNLLMLWKEGRSCRHTKQLVDASNRRKHAWGSCLPY